MYCMLGKGVVRDKGGAWKGQSNQLRTKYKGDEDMLRCTYGLYKFILHLWEN